MNWLRISGALQISLLLTMITVGGSPSRMAVIASAFCGVLIATWTMQDSSRMAYSGWSRSFFFTLIYYVLPFAALVYALFGITVVPLLLSTACAVHVELFRERRTGEHQLGWAALPLVSVSIALWLQLGDIRTVIFEALALTALICTSVTLVRITEPPIVVLEDTSAKHEDEALQAHEPPRSFHRAA